MTTEGERPSIPDHNEAVNAALRALAEAYLAGKPRQGAIPGEQKGTERFILQQIQAGGMRDVFAAVLADRIDAVPLPPLVLVRLLLDAIELPLVRRQLETSERESNTSWKRVDSALRIMRDTSITHDKRMRKALFEFGVTSDYGGKGLARVDHRLIANHYYALRCGDEWRGEVLPAHNHAEAVAVIEEEYGKDWASLRRAWNRKGIEVSTDAEVFPKK